MLRCGSMNAGGMSDATNVSVISFPAATSEASSTTADHRGEINRLQIVPHHPRFDLRKLQELVAEVCVLLDVFPYPVGEFSTAVRLARGIGLLRQQVVRARGSTGGGILISWEICCIMLGTNRFHLGQGSAMW